MSIFSSLTGPSASCARYEPLVLDVPPSRSSRENRGTGSGRRPQGLWSGTLSSKDPVAVRQGDLVHLHLAHSVERHRPPEEVGDARLRLEAERIPLVRQPEPQAE